MSIKNNTLRLKAGKPQLFSPAVNRTLRDSLNEVGYKSISNLNDVSGSAIGVTGSFKYNPMGFGLVSTQQLNVNWSAFENHTFFNSAQVKTNVAFDKIVNEFPFDGTKKDIEEFSDKLTGFEKWVLDNMHHNKSYINFSGSLSGTLDGPGVIVKDFSGAQYLAISKNISGDTVIDPGTRSMTIEMHLYIPNQNVNISQPILTKVTSSLNGFGVVLEALSGSTGADVSFMVVSGVYEDRVAVNVPYDEWHHVSWVWDRLPGNQRIYSYLDNVYQLSSSVDIEFGSLGTNGSDLLIGSGSSFGTFVPSNTFSGSIDELRIWHSIRTNTQRKEYEKKSVFSENNLKLYFKFNEPSGSNSSVVLDYSGRSLHGKLNDDFILFGTRDLATLPHGPSPIINETELESVVLFPNTETNSNFRGELLLSASNFDLQNPSLITNLIPQHYLEEGQDELGFETIEGEITSAPSNNYNNPKEHKLGSTQILLSLLYTWAKFFDEMKLFIQAFGTLKTLGYDEYDTMPNDFLSVFARNEGIELPPMFTGAEIKQYLEGNNLDNINSKNTYSLQTIQNQIWKRILINMRDFISSKGTIHSLKAFIRSTGIDPDNTFRIREYGGPTKRTLDYNREKRSEVSTMLNFVSGGIIVSPPLTVSGVKGEPGWPYQPLGVANNKFLPFLTSGSFTFEAIYKFPTNIDIPESQSLVRFEVANNNAVSTVSNPNNQFQFTSKGLLLNVVATKENVTLIADPFYGVVGNTWRSVVLPITGVNIFDGNLWNLSVSKKRNDSFGSVSSSYELRLAKQNNGEVDDIYVTSSFGPESIQSAFNGWNFMNTGGAVDFYSRRYPVFKIGSGSVRSFIANYIESSNNNVFARETRFNGKVSQIRFWSKYLELEEWKEHVRNFKSIGTKNPWTNFNFFSMPSGSLPTGSWERLRVDASTDQIITNSNDIGEIFLTNFTQTTPFVNYELLKSSSLHEQYYYLSGCNFPPTSSVIEPEIFYYSFISPKIDVGVQENKVRVRGYQDTQKIIDRPWAQLTPVNEILYYEQPTDSTKLSIDFSITDALDQDIITLFSSLDELNNVIGNPELMFSSEYKSLETLREIYFNRLTDKINYKSFFDFYKWFDVNLGSFVEQLLPSKTKFLGSNFIIESHLLERAKIQYQFEDIYLGEDIRSGLKDTILLQLIEGDMSKY